MILNDFSRCLSTTVREPAAHPRRNSQSAAGASRQAPQALCQELESALSVEISIVIPVFNARESLQGVVDEICAVFDGDQYELILVNDGSRDDSERICRAIVDRRPERVTFIQLTRNFGEHHAVLAGLGHARGNHVGVLDDDGQNPPEELHRMWRHIQKTGDDVVYGRYREKRHGWFRNVGSRLHNGLATLLLGKPSSLYLSSFKVMSQTVVQEVVRQAGPFPYLDGVIVQSTDRICQVEVAHREREQGRSGYTLRKLVRLSLAMCFGYSLWPLRLSFLLGAVTSAVAIVLLVTAAIQHLWLQAGTSWGSASIGLAILCVTGVQLISLGILGEYVGRLWLRQNGAPSYVVRYVRGGGPADA
jgi:glycosyltransferase involved in cell wall biosynthesis